MKSVLITGAGGGIGLSIADLLSTKGYELHLIVKSDLSESLIENFFKSRDVKFFVYKVDLADIGSIDDFIFSFSTKLWALINNAGICETFRIDENGLDPFERIMRTNLFGPYYLSKSLVNLISSPGRIVNISSQLGKEGRSGYGAYCASKFGLLGLTKCWAKELGPRGITVNAVCPGWVSTEMAMNDLLSQSKKLNVSIETLYKMITDPLELNRFNSPGEVAELIHFLISEQAGGITGRDFLMQTIWNQM